MADIKVKHQIAMVLDLNKCMGCQTCSIACKRLWTREEGMEYMWWNTVNTMPGLGTPKGWEKMGGGFKNGKPVRGQLPSIDDFGSNWEFNYEEIYYSGKGQKNYLKPNPAAKWGMNWDEDEGAGKWPNSYFFYLPRICNHCTHPACLEACPRKAIYKRVEDGIVVIDQTRCKGYRFCMEACPYKKIYFNELKAVAQKCIFCFPRIEQGITTACSRQCPGRVRFVGMLDDEDGPIYKLVKKWKVALPLHPEYGTQPNVFYVPPLSPSKLDADFKITNEPRIPLEYLESLFGKEVGKVIETLKAERQKKMNGGKSEILDTLIGYRWPKDFFKIPKGKGGSLT
jgi:ethylbenzene hydroxylase subunit beta/complex iron-sulfur molybdoenzyme family reductase subunit beta